MFAALLLPLAAAAQTTGSITADRSLPRFVSLKSDKVNVRGGPSREHDVTWTYQRSGLPVEIIAEFDNWRRIRDWEGTESWVFHAMLSGKRMVLVTPRAKDGMVPVYSKAEGHVLVAQLEPRVQAQARSCDGQWCRLIGPGFDGYIEQARLWGVYPGEKF